MKNLYQVKAFFAGLLLSCSMVPVALAEDIEIYTTPGAQTSASNPNIIFIVDTSMSMGVETLVNPDYNSSTPYTGACESTGIYFQSNGLGPDCATSEDYFNVDALVCDRAVSGYDNNNVRESPREPGTLVLFGTYSDQLAQYDSRLNRWRELDIDRTTVGDSDRDFMVECISDSGDHGASTGGNQNYIRNGGSGYTNTAPSDLDVPHPVWASGAGNVQLFSGNYINYLETVFPDNQKVLTSYIDQVKGAVEIMVRGNTQIDIGLMRYDRLGNNGSGSEGGSVNYPIIDIIADRNDFFSRLNTLDSDGKTPLSETYYEALLYYGGKAMDYSRTSNPGNQVTNITEKSGNVEFRSPIASTCDKNFIVVLSDGNADKDNVNTQRGIGASAVDRLDALSGFDKTSCNTSVTLTDDTDDNDDPSDDIVTDDVDARNYTVTSTDNCLDELADWAATQDVAVEASNAAHEGDQHIITHTIGFAATDPDGIQLLQATATSGKGDYFTADSKGELVSIFNKIIASILDVNTTFSSPAVSVNAFNRTTHLDDLYFTLFKPGESSHWDGNLKKYKLEFEVDTLDRDGDGNTTERLPFIADQNSTALAPVRAVADDTGFFKDSAQSFWSDSVDGKEVANGGAVGEFLSRGANGDRKVYTLTGGYAASTTGVHIPAVGNLKDSANLVHVDTAALTAALLAIPATPVMVSGTSNRDTVINWAKGEDALSKHGAVDTYDDPRPRMGDPLHAEPALVQYGESAPGVADLVAYTATNDGYLHAFDVSDGHEIFSFIPPELLPNLQLAMSDAGGNKLYGLDGSVAAWINDADGDGTIEPDDGEHVYLYITMRRGGRNIYALDVSVKDSPVLLWTIKGGTGEYSELGQTWSTVNVAKVKDGVTGTVDTTVLIFGGGYDAGQDTASVTSEDGVGRTVYIANATSGARLWDARADVATVTPNLGFSMPARIAPLDISGDGYVDRLYATDMGGQVFRFDIDNTNTSSLGNSVIGGRIADLADASKDAADRTPENARRFYYPPDVALIDADDGPYHGLVLSSGFRAHPLNDDVHDRIYMIKDRNTASITSVSDYNFSKSPNVVGPLTEINLYNATTNLAGGEGGTDIIRQGALDNITSKEGWFIQLDDENNSGSWIGEKGLAEALIIGGTAIVTTYTPNLTSSTASCEPNLGLGKVFFINILDATAAFPSNLDSRSDRHTELMRGGIPPTPNVVITESGEPTLCIGTECQAADFGLGVRKTYWYEVSE
jgi:type IV pilus assembly protein PilY1